VRAQRFGANLSRRRHFDPGLRVGLGDNGPAFPFREVGVGQANYRTLRLGSTYLQSNAAEILLHSTFRAYRRSSSTAPYGSRVCTGGKSNDADANAEREPFALDFFIAQIQPWIFYLSSCCYVLYTYTLQLNTKHISIPFPARRVECLEGVDRPHYSWPYAPTRADP
jgi:hypothetical protein